MNESERRAILKKLNELCIKYEYDWEDIVYKLDEEPIEYNFFEDLYEILYHFPCDEKKLLIRIFKLLDMPLHKKH